MPTRRADAVWKGSLKEGQGTLKTESGILNSPYNYVSRFQEGDQTNPEELVGAAHAGCYAMFLSALLSGDNYTVNEIKANAAVTLTPGEGGPTVTEIVLTVTGNVDGIEEDAFLDYAQRAKERCPISKALAAVASIQLNASLLS